MQASVREVGHERKSQSGPLLSQFQLKNHCSRFPIFMAGVAFSVCPARTISMVSCVYMGDA